MVRFGGMKKIEEVSILQNKVQADSSNTPIKVIASLFLEAMNDWPTKDQNKIAEFVEELKEYYGFPLTKEKITAKEFNGDNAWQIEAGSSIVQLIDVAQNNFGYQDFDNIVNGILKHYEEV
jgi:hypothetical protein